MGTGDCEDTEGGISRFAWGPREGAWPSGFSGGAPSGAPLGETVILPPRHPAPRGRGKLGEEESLGDGDLGGAGKPLPSPAAVRRQLLTLSVVASALAVVLFVSWATVHGTSAFLSPLLWAAIAAFWASVFHLLYYFTVDAVVRTMKAQGASEVVGARVLWLPQGTARTVGASMEFEGRGDGKRLPAVFSLYLGVNLLWAIHVIGLKASWACKESGVLLLTPTAPRFLAGATAESLELPSPEVAAIRGLLAKPGELKGMPDWGTPAGAHARAALAEVVASDWLLGPEQPFLALEAFGGRLEKFWPPIAQQIADLDVEGALDLLTVVCAFDRDAMDARRARLTSSPSSHRPSSPQP